ncbi:MULTISPECIES: ABC transporter ATP-binding protein [unclassified Avibacterium]|uniref:ABC transporter ATP-binding protein n=1 Tax=unclassified Avibacterium TaxID=2685287 RepID=UPI002025E332|nr:MULTISPECIES: ABC transporter ATP-binding protein [unclassified Avibacterium]MCW9697857.1 ABC transporter ATP-binding protein [Avibacterium sp. 20-129]MCW9714959.1 ABC transporter ATP-binding protein [Avibacterium sp. 21-594]MCW9718286.1 ABC transporter ATP-binding protein [Avibacterium sp. 21-599]URL05805.1 ABC transporter ATP-binding protein [Avibacterium sp. 21-595]
MKAIDISDLQLNFAEQPLFSHFHFTVSQGEWVALLGASGVGKSTLLRAIAGLEHQAITQGNIKCSGKIAWLAQQDSLYPWLSILDNVQLYQHLTHSKTKKTEEKARALLSAVKMEQHLHKPCYQLSGGQRQRVALARTLMQEAEIILMDEPFSALDAVTRLQLQQLSHRLLKDKTVLLITHDPQEALLLADKIYILRQQPVQLSEPICPQGNAPRDFSQEKLWQLQQYLFAQLMEEQ